MRVIHQLPHPALAPYVRCYWDLTHTLAPNEALDVAFGCTGRAHLIIPLINTFYKSVGESEPYQAPACGIHGQHTKPVTKHFSGLTRALVVDFTPTGMYALWPMPTNELTNLTLDLSEVGGSVIRELTEQLLNTPGPTQRFAVLEAYLLRRLRQVVTTATDGRLEAAVWQLQQRPGFVKVRQLANYLNCTERTLNRRFTEVVGVPPKMYARVQRFLQTLRWLNQQQQHPKRHWHDLVTAAGYYDQSHLIHEFKAFAGRPPQLYGIDQQLLSDFMR